MATERRTRKDDAAPHCSRCGTEMKDVVTIAPLADEPGLIAYECPSVLALTEDSQITKMVRVCGHEDAGMHLAVS